MKNIKNIDYEHQDDKQIHARHSKNKAVSISAKSVLDITSATFYDTKN